MSRLGLYWPEIDYGEIEREIDYGGNWTGKLITGKLNGEIDYGEIERRNCLRGNWNEKLNREIERRNILRKNLTEKLIAGKLDEEIGYINWC